MDCPECQTPDMTTGAQAYPRMGEARAWAHCNHCGLHVGGRSPDDVLATVILIRIGREAPVVLPCLGPDCPLSQERTFHVG